MKINNSKGFTLVNVLVTLALIAILEVIFIAQLHKFQKSAALDNYAQKLASDIKYAQQQSILNQSSYAVIFNNSINGYYLSSINPTTTTIRTILWPNNISYQIQGFTNSIIFNYPGITNTDGKISLQDNNKKIILNITQSGHVQLQTQ